MEQISVEEISKILQWCKSNKDTYIEIKSESFKTFIWVYFKDLFKGFYINSLEELKKAYDNAVLEQEAIDNMLKEN